MTDGQVNEILNGYQGACYVFDIAELHRRVDSIRARMPERAELCYAIKANTFIAKDMAKWVARFEVCSPGEAEVCRVGHIPTEKMVISGVYKTPSVMEGMVSDRDFRGIFTVESVEQFRLLNELAQKHQRRIPLLIRLTAGSQFGVEESQVVDIIRDHAGDPLLDIVGIQYFSGTQKQSLKRLKRELDYVDGFITRLKEELDFDVQELEFGPGFPVTYFVSEQFDEDAHFAGFSELLENMTFRGKVILELGRSIAASCGSYFTKVVDAKCNKGQNYAIVDGGMHQLVYFGQSMAMKQPVMNLYPVEAGREEGSWNICGSLCTTNDIIVKQMPLPDLQIGDVLRFRNTGAYCMTEGISLFLTRELPRIQLLEEDGTLITVRETIETSRFNQADF